MDLLRRPLQALWKLRQVSAPLTGQVHLSVPLAGGPPRPEAAARITRYLEQMWVDHPVESGLRVTSVAATIVPDPAPDAPAPHRLILMATHEVATAERTLDTAHMARHLDTALLQAG